MVLHNPARGQSKPRALDHEAQMETHRYDAQDIGNESASHLPEGKRTKKRRKHTPESIYHVIIFSFQIGLQTEQYKVRSEKVL